MRSGIVLACLVALALAAAGAGVAVDASGTQSTAGPVNATTGEVHLLNETTASLTGTVTVGNNTAGTARMEFRERSSRTARATATPTASEWRRTRPRKFTARNASSPERWLHWNVSGLQPGTTYEYRLHVTVGNDTTTGAVRTFTMNESVGGLTPTPTPVPCPSFRGAGASSLCTTTPTPPPTPTDTSPVVVDDVSPSDSTGPAEDSGDWLAGIVPMLLWIGAVVVVAPVVLGGLLGLDSLRRE